MIPLAIPNIGPAEARNLQKCVEDNFVSTVGGFVTELESKVAALSGTAYGAAMGSGTQGLHLALRALNVGHGDLVIVPSFTFIASANAISHTGAEPWFVDIDPGKLDAGSARLARGAAQRDGTRAGRIWSIALPAGRSRRCCRFTLSAQPPTWTQ